MLNFAQNRIVIETVPQAPSPAICEHRMSTVSSFLSFMTICYVTPSYVTVIA